MKKIFIICSVILMLFGCSSSSKPSATVENYLKAYKDMSTEQMNKYRMKQVEDDISAVVDEENHLYELLSDLLTNLDYKLSNEKIDGDNATVDIEVSTYDLQLLIANVVNEYFTEAYSLVLAGATNEMLEAKMIDIFAKQTKELERTKKYKATIKLTKIDSAWRINDEETDNIAFLNAITANLASVMDSFDQIEE